jgi:hypothetical protein
MDSFCADPCAGGHWAGRTCIITGLAGTSSGHRGLIAAHFRGWFLKPGQGLFLHCQVGLAKGGKPNEEGLNFLLAVVKGIEPRDQVEAMLATHMTVTHNNPRYTVLHN